MPIVQFVHDNHTTARSSRQKHILTDSATTDVYFLAGVYHPYSRCLELQVMTRLSTSTSQESVTVGLKTRVLPGHAGCKLNERCFDAMRCRQTFVGLMNIPRCFACTYVPVLHQRSGSTLNLYKKERKLFVPGLQQLLFCDYVLNMVASENTDGANLPEMPSVHEIHDFTQKVEEASILIDGLSKGTISPAYVDSKLTKESTPQVHTSICHSGTQSSSQRTVHRLMPQFCSMSRVGNTECSHPVLRLHQQGMSKRVMMTSSLARNRYKRKLRRSRRGLK